MTSIWNQETQIPERKALHENIRVQTAVIGAGMAGILIAYFLKKEGMDVIVVEADRIAGGQTKNTTAKITSQHGMIYDKMIKKAGEERARGYAMANEDAIKFYERIVREEEIDCEFQKLPACLYSTDKARIEELEREAKTAGNLGIEAYFLEGSELKELPFEAAGAVCFENQAQFNPLKFVKQLSEKLVIYENTKVLSVEEHVILTDKGNIVADNIVFATHYPFLIVPGLYPFRQHQERSYVLALSGQKKLNGMYYSIDEGGLSLRSAGEMLLLGGGAHRTGKQKENEIQCQGCAAEGFSYIREKAKIYYPDRKETAHWAAQDCMTHDSIPFIGKYSVIRPYWYIATGFNKWGMTSSMVSAMIINDQIHGRKNSYENTFTPQRLLFRASIKNLLADTGQSIAGLSKGLFSEKDRKCPHMGCRLTWNPDEESFDCPCHGSRFDKDGELIDNPAQVSLFHDRINR
ncbi:MAG: FAD-dependent oxidoreductase [Suilimivivens sp.]